jgi:hypothetical protein
VDSKTHNEINSYKIFGITTNHHLLDTPVKWSMTFCLCSPHTKSLEYIFLQRLTRQQEQWTNKLKLTRSLAVRYVTTLVSAATQGRASGRRRGLCAANILTT